MTIGKQNCVVDATCVATAPPRYADSRMAAMNAVWGIRNNRIARHLDDADLDHHVLAPAHLGEHLVLAFPLDELAASARQDQEGRDQQR